VIRLRPVRRPGVAGVQRPCPADQPADGDDRVGAAGERVDDVPAAPAAALQPAEAVAPGAARNPADRAYPRELLVQTTASASSISEKAAAGSLTGYRPCMWS